MFIALGLLLLKEMTSPILESSFLLLSPESEIDGSPAMPAEAEVDSEPTFKPDAVKI